LGKNSDVSIRFYQPGDDENIVDLLKKTFPKWKEFDDPLGLWRWKYINTPFKNFIVVAVKDDKIIGFEHSLILNAKLGSEITTLSYGDDAAVDIDYRGLGIWKKISTYCEEQYYTLTKYSYSTTSNPIVVETWIKRNRSFFPFPVTRMMKTHDIDLQLQTRPMKNELLVKLGYFGLNIMNKILNLFRKPINHSDDFSIIKVSEFDEGIDSFWEKIKDDYNFIIEKKRENLNWRFTDNDRSNHIKIQAMNGDEVLGYIVVGYKEGDSEGQIEDLLTLKDRLDVANALFDYGSKCLDDLGVNTVFYQAVVGHPYQVLSRRKGFIDSRSTPNIEFDFSDTRNKTSEVPFIKFTTPSQVHFTYATTL
jgi:hypothetical protein